MHERAGRPFECERCGSRFRQRAHKQKHVAAVHLKEKPYTCKICLHCFGRRSDLYVDYCHRILRVVLSFLCVSRVCRAMHARIILAVACGDTDALVRLACWEYLLHAACSVRPPTFLSDDNRNKHDRLVHKRERPYGCDFPGCHARFGQKGDSKKHMATHERSEARRRAAAAAVVATAAAVTGDTATSGAVAAVDDLSGRGPLGDWHSPKERPGAVRGSGWRQTEREWEVEDGDDADCADKADDLTSRPDDDDGNEEKEADDQDEEGSEGLAATGMYRA